MDAVTRAGGLPVAVGHDPALAEAVLKRLDGLVVTGGAFDIGPEYYGKEAVHALTVPKPGRTAGEVALVRAALARGIPVLGICGGMQLLAVVLGGTLIQHIPDAVPGALAHEQPNSRDEAGHEIAVLRGTLLHDVVGGERMAVNSSHHQAVLSCGRGRVSAVAPDGVIEAIEGGDDFPGKSWCLGVQWHPEFAIDPGDDKIFAAFVAAARKDRG